VLWPFVRHQVARDWPLVRKQPGIIVFLALLGGALFGTLQFVGLQYTSALNVSVMNSLTPVLIVLASAAMFRDRIDRLQSVGIGVSLAGVFVIITRLDPAVVGGLACNRGELIILLNQGLWAVYAVCLRLRPPIHWLSFMFWFSLISGVSMLPFFAWEASTGYVLQPTLLTFAAIAFVTLFSTVGGFALWTRGVELIGPNRAGVFLHLIPVYSALLTGVLLGEPLMAYHVLGFALILAGVWFAARR
jgi:drug/metabolite transporter (DMT)-like permease